MFSAGRRTDPYATPATRTKKIGKCRSLRALPKTGAIVPLTRVHFIIYGSVYRSGRSEASVGHVLSRRERTPTRAKGEAHCPPPRRA